MNSDPADYQILVHLFGATSSPSCANLGLKQTASDNQEVFSKEAIDTIIQNFYVDDCLQSMRSKSKAISLVSELCELLSIESVPMSQEHFQ